MSDYSTWKVADLKAELRRRDIPQTGLRLKQQFIDKLVEIDNRSSGVAAAGAVSSSAEEGRKGAVGGRDGGEGDVSETQAPAQREPEASQESRELQEQKLSAESGQDGGEKKGTGEEEGAGATDAVVGQASTEKAAEPQIPAIATEVTNEAKPDESQEVSEEARGVTGTGDVTTAGPAEKNKAGAEQTAEPEPEPKPDARAEPVTESKPEATTTTEPISETEPEARNEAAAAAAAEPVEKAPEVPVGPEAEKDGIAETRVQQRELTTENEGREQTALSGTDSSTPVPPEEAVEDARKRKRRSVTPVPAPEEIAKKKAKMEEDSSQMIITQNGAGTGGSSQPQQEVDAARRASASEEQLRTRRPVPDARFKDLFMAPEPERLRPASPEGDAVMDDVEAEPALHAATVALYIDGLMRPLQPGALKSHLVSLASAPGDSPKADVILDFYLDPIKTHCFVSFTSVSAASRVRSALHGAVWPNERNRKKLFVDFVPEDKAREWVEVEEGTQRGGGRPTRWEVKYESTPDGVEAVLREVDTKASAPRSNAGEPGTMRPPPLGPRADFVAANSRKPSSASQSTNTNLTADTRPPRPGQGFKALDELFRSTTTKPKLYYQPVPREVVDRRLDRFDDLIRKGSFPRRGGGETRRFSFEDTDLFVDNGPEFGGGRNNNTRRRRRGRRGGGGVVGDSWRRDRY